MSTTLYIYFRVPRARAAELQPALQDMQDRLRAMMPGLAAALMRRSDEDPAADSTWMEVYHFNGHADQRAWEAFEAALGRQLQALPPGLMGERHAERFEMLSRADGLSPQPGRA